ncbi:Sugar transporter SWEET1 [Caenorhabditis elegans]|uniref:Sugar transporter SWEET1 n=1 Tax=Caenorhabditis elegans TaxID=6239 RepID=SWET1_CAEEL|nr:Sugar transporter SWEET1 [Caenorhabditis elegans]O45102.1 RecName: Full=Sugar transporter SWEET1; Short=CeSWEET1 [Caenorhabditis elegans]CCD69688.1 Sugar transporter SWEET1 [Caenorhabditis elegans]|eukprot:NP_499901.1 Sugar transporter SWEET1 [Caenorhabditis elegans]
MLEVVLQVLSISAITTTIALFFCGIPICMQIRRQGAVGDISGVPFLMGVLGGSFWLRYGLLKMDYVMIIVNVVGVACMAFYCVFFLIYSLPKKTFTCQLILVTSTIGGMVLWIALKPNLDYLGVICMTFNIMNFGAPLAGLGVVLKNREVSTLPLPMCVANFLVSSQWCLYGNLVSDIYIIIPNGIGMFLAIVQLALFVVLPIRENEKSPLEKLASWFTGRDSKVKDLERGDCIVSSPPSSPQKVPNETRSDVEDKFDKLMAETSSTIPSDSRRGSMGSPPSYKSRSSSDPDLSSIQSP